MLTFPPFKFMISKEDKQALKSLENVNYRWHEEGGLGFGYDLIYTFGPNDYFTNTQLTI